MEKYMSRRSFAGFMLISAASLGLALNGCGKNPTPSDGGSDGSSTKVDGTADLIVIGGGGAGLAGAARAAQGGASVILLEGSYATGGTTAICGGHWKFMDQDLLDMLPERTEDHEKNLQTLLDLSASDFPAEYASTLSKLQSDIREYLASDLTREFDSLEMWLIQHYQGVTGKQLDPDGKVVAPAYDLIYPAYANSGMIKDWLVGGGLEYQAFGKNFGDSGGPFSADPTGPVPQGSAFITVLQKFAEDAGAEIITNAKVNTLIEDGGKIVGVQTEKGKTYMANHGVLLASGGFGSNAERVAKEDVRWTFTAAGLASCEPDTNDGTALAAAEAIGAKTANLGFNQYQTFPASGAASIETTIPMCMMASVIAVNKEGVRYRDDSGRFGTQSTSISLGQTDNAYFMIGDASGIGAMGELREKYESTGDLAIADTIEECATKLGLPAATVADTVAKWNSYVDAGEDPDFGRNMGRAAKIETAPFSIMAMREYVQHTMGGVCIDPTGHVVDESGNAIEGLFAAGEAVGNLDGAQRRHGDNFAQLLYYGWLAGDTVAKAIA